MYLPDEQASKDSNPYQAPLDVRPVETSLPADAYAMPPLHWPRTIIIFVVLAIGGLVTYGTTLLFAFAVLFGGIRTALIFRGCSKLGRVPPSYMVSTILSPISCFVFQVAAGITFFFVCASRFSFNNPTLSEQAWLSMSGVISLAVFVGLYVLSIKVAIASCRVIS